MALESLLHKWILYLVATLISLASGVIVWLINRSNMHSKKIAELETQNTHQADRLKLITSRQDKSDDYQRQLMSDVSEIKAAVKILVNDLQNRQK